MQTAIDEFIDYAGLAGMDGRESGTLSLQLESGTTVNIEMDKRDENVIVSVFYPAPWKLLELGAKALRLVHYKESSSQSLSAGIFQDRLVLSARLNKSHQGPQEIERTAQHLCLLAEQCAQQADQPAAMNEAFAAEGYRR